MFDQLTRANVLVVSDKTCRFSSTNVKRVYFHALYSKRCYDNPGSLKKLVQRLIASMSTNALNESAHGSCFPDYEGLAKLTTDNAFTTQDHEHQQPTASREMDVYMNFEEFFQDDMKFTNHRWE